MSVNKKLESKYIPTKNNMTLIIFASIITLIFVIIFVLIWHTNNSVNILFDGFYSADPVFCEESNLEMMILYLDKGDGYIMIKGADGSILLNDVIQYSLINKSHTNLSISKSYLYQIKFKGIDYQDFFPMTQMLEFIPSTQRIKLYDGEENKIHAILYKNNTVSDIKQLISD